jgi:hypothetical protein
MSYEINKTNGGLLARIEDGTINNSSSSLTLIGRNYAGYGEIHNENFIRLLENSAANTAPPVPLPGQLWFDTATSLLKIYNGTVFKVISSATAAASTPASNVAGDLWFDTVAGQLKAYNGSAFITVGPSYTSSTGISGAIVDTIVDASTGASHVIVKLFVNTVVVAIISKDATFTPAVAIPGFATIGPGYNLNTTLSDAVFKGTATNSQLLDNLDSTDFMRSTTNTSTTGTLSVLNDTGILIGVDSDLKLLVSGTDSYIRSQTNNGNVYLQVNDGGVTTTCVTLVGTSSNVSVNTNLTVTGSATAGNITVTGNLTGNVLGTATNVTAIVAIANGGTNAATAAGARTNLGLGTIATQSSSSVSITGGSIAVASLSNAVSLAILNSAGTTLKTIYGTSS